MKTNYFLSRFKIILLYLFSTLILVFFFSTCRGQLTGQMRAGYADHSGIVSPAIGYTFKGFTVMPEMIIYTSDDKPVKFGGKISYQYKFIEAGAGYYCDKYSMDKERQYENRSSSLVFIAAHYNRFFIEYDYNRGNVFSLGMREPILR